MHRQLAQASLAGLLCLAMGPSLAAVGFGELLRDAEAVRSSDPAEFQRLLSRLNLAIGEATPEQREQLDYLKAYQLAYTGRYDLAINAAKSLFQNTRDDTLKFRAGALIANSHAATREFTEGLRYLDQTLSLIDRIQDRDLRHNVLLVAAILYNQIGQHELGLGYVQQVLADHPDARNQCYASHLRLESLLNLGTLADTDPEMEAVASQCADSGEALGANLVRLHLARHRAQSGERYAAMAYMYQHLPQMEATRYPHLVGEAHALLAELRLADGKLQDAEMHAQQAIANSDGISHSLPLVMAYKTLFEVARQRGDDARALELFQQYAAADKAYLDDVKARELAFQLARHETLQKSQTIELLNKQNEVLRLEQQVMAKSTQNNRLLIALLGLLLASIGYWAFKVKRMQLSFRHLAETDALTGISNRHHFSRRAEDALVYCRKSGEEAGLVMMDLDNFKTINDHYGHAIGDWTLQQVARICAQACRQNDLVGRLGGEEFAFLLVGCGLDASTELAEQCRQAIAGIDTRECGHSFQITASFGVAGSRHTNYSLGALMVQADDALYRSKHEGRNRVTVHVEPTPAFNLARPLA